MSLRVQRVESVVRQTVARHLPELLGANSGRVSVTAVEASPDLRQATVWIDVLGDNSEALFKEVVEVRAQLQQEVAAAMTTKFIPRLHLRLDKGGEYADHISRLLGS
jgi:ribosome-binding factor A